MRTLLQVRNNILTSAGRDDLTASSLIDMAINMALEVICLVFKPPESRMLAELTFNTGETELLILTQSNLIDLISVYNSTDLTPMGFIPLELLRAVTPSGDVVRFYNRDGNSLLIRPAPIHQTVVELRYSAYPTRLTSDSQEIPYNGYDGQVIAIATAIYWACVEETESSTLWQKIVDILGVAQGEATKARGIIEGLPSLKEG